LSVCQFACLLVGLLTSDLEGCYIIMVKRGTNWRRWWCKLL